VFWDHGAATAQEARDRLAEKGPDLAYTTVATLVRILVDKGFLSQTNAERPFVYEAIRSFDEVSHKLVDHMLKRVFAGSREKLLVSLFGEQRLTKKERAALEQLLKETK
jgi:predicted transcriptional regulator